MLILLAINAFIINPTFLPCQVGNTLFSQNFFVGMAIFHLYLLDSRRADICLVTGEKSEIKADFHPIFPKYNCIIK